jgi:hypothetical protein
MTHVVCGGVTMFGIGAEDGVIGWGQNAANCDSLRSRLRFERELT